MAGEHRINKSAGRSTGRQRSRKTECNKPAEAMRYNEELRPSITARITIQDTLDPYDVYFIWDGQEKHVPQNVINLRENLLDFSRLVPKEYEGLFRGYMNEGTKSRESIWIKSIAVELIFKGLEFDIHNQGYSEVFDRLKMVDNAQFLKQQCGKLVEHVGPGGLTKPRPDLLFGLPVLKPDEIKRFAIRS
ncbi:hypothetical protein K440DRAFT_389690 [Wilcoxina mikolae CBS 423.85]|nr:hypothetical protein K440DRAFT_389690 [Wilcoxina mikolae CBS 423.85]